MKMRKHIGKEKQEGDMVLVMEMKMQKRNCSAFLKLFKTERAEQGSSTV